MVPVRQAGAEVTTTFWAKLVGHYKSYIICSLLSSGFGS